MKPFPTERLLELLDYVYISRSAEMSAATSEAQEIVLRHRRLLDALPQWEAVLRNHVEQGLENSLFKQAAKDALRAAGLMEEESCSP